MATGTIPERAGGYTLKTGSQTFADKHKRQLARNLRVPILVMTADGAIPVQPSIVILAGADAPLGCTLAAPVAADNGLKIQFICGTEQEHVVTATGLIDDGVTGGAKNTATMTNGFLGCSFELMAYNLHWVVTHKNVAVIA